MPHPCRTCGETKSMTVPIYDAKNAAHNLEMKINSYLPIQVDRADAQMPLELCLDCCRTLLAFHEMYTKCHEADINLRKLLVNQSLSKKKRLLKVMKNDRRNKGNDENTNFNASYDNLTDKDDNKDDALAADECSASPMAYLDMADIDDNKDDVVAADGSSAYPIAYLDVADIDDNKDDAVAADGSSASPLAYLDLAYIDDNKDDAVAADGSSASPLSDIDMADTVDNKDDAVAADGSIENASIPPSAVDDLEIVPAAEFVATAVKTADGAMQITHNIPPTDNTLTLLILPEPDSIPTISTNSDVTQLVPNRPLVLEGKVRCVPMLPGAEVAAAEANKKGKSKITKAKGIGIIETGMMLLEESRRAKNVRNNGMGSSVNFGHVTKENVRHPGESARFDDGNTHSDYYDDKTNYGVDDDNSKGNRTYEPKASSIPGVTEPTTSPNIFTEQVLELVECSSCLCMYLDEDLKDHVNACLGMGKIPQTRQPTELKPITKTGIDTKRIKELLGINEITVETKEVDNPVSSKLKIKVVKKGAGNIGKVKIVGDKYICGMCDKEFRGSLGFIKHRKTECEFCHFECSQCGWRFKKNLHLVKHMSMACGNDVQKYNCSICGKSFRNKEYLNGHVKYHFLERSSVCDQCPMKFKRVDHLRRHKENKHGQPRPVWTNAKFICPLCSAQFSNESRFRTHELRHQGVATTMCEKCGRGFFSSASLKYHQSRAPTCDVKKPYEKRAEYIRKQAEYRKNGQNKKYPCAECTREFRFPSLLKMHIKGFHRKELPFRCKLCDMRFNDSNALARHKVKEHKGYRLSCKICLAGVANPSALKMHMFTHKTVKEFECPSCHRAFKYKGDMTRHCKQCLG